MRFLVLGISHARAGSSILRVPFPVSRRRFRMSTRTSVAKRTMPRATWCITWECTFPVMNPKNPFDTARWLLRATAWLIAAVSAWYFLAQWLAPDGCLDSGGSFDYETWQCSFEVNPPYVEA